MKTQVVMDIKAKRLTRAQAIKAKCLDCCAGSIVERRLCPATDCSLWPFRCGKEEKIPEDPDEKN